MITMIYPLAVGNAAQILIDPPPGALYWRLLRRTADVFSGPDDQGAVLVADFSTDNSIIDIAALVNGTDYFWHDYAWTGAEWVDGGRSVSCVPATTYDDASPDVQEIVRSRLEAAMAAEVARGTFRPRAGAIPVVTAPFQMAESLSFPIISVHFESASPTGQFIGGTILPEVPDPSAAGYADWSNGWLDQVTLSIVSVSLNSDERIALRQAVVRAIAANLGVFEAQGIVEVSVNRGDEEDFSSEKAGPLFLTRHTFSCVAPTVVTGAKPVTSEVEFSAIINGDSIYA